MMYILLYTVENQFLHFVFKRDSYAAHERIIQDLLKEVLALSIIECELLY